MRRLRLDYLRAERPMPWLGVLLLAAGLAVLATVGLEYRTLSQQMRAWEDQADRLARESSRRAPPSRPLSEAAAKALRVEVKQANLVVRELGLPWNALFDAVDASASDGIALLALEPDPQKGTVKISGEARDLGALLAYVQQLEGQAVFAGVLLQGHQVQREVPEKPLRFSLLAHWKERSS